MASVSPILIGSGIQPGPTFTLGHLVYVSAVGPPAQLSSYAPVRALDGAVEYTGVPDSALVYPAVAGATETFRLRGGLITEGAGTDTIIIGRGAAASGTDSIAIGSDAHSTTSQSTVIGANALDNGQQGVVVGYNAGLSASAGVAVGNGAAVSGNAGGATGVAIGQGASAAGSSAGGGTHIAIGPNAVAKAEDVVIGGNASSNQQSAFGVGSVVIGTSATANVAGGSVFAVVIGWNAVSTQKLATIVGSGATATAAAAQNRAIVIGSGASATATDAIVIGGGSALTTTSIAIGAGAVDLGAGFAQIGTPSTPITTILFGAGDTIAAPAAKTMRYTNATGADSPAGNVTIIGARSTGNAAAASYIIQIGQQVAGSSSVLQTAGNAVAFSHTTAGGHLATFSNNVTVSGNAGIGTAPQSAIALIVAPSNTLTGTSQTGFNSQPVFNNTATAIGRAAWLFVSTRAIAYTMVNGYALHVDVPVVGAASAITTNTGVRIENQGAAGITNAYGLFIAGPTGAATINTAAQINGGVGTVIIGSTGQSLTGSLATTMVDLASTWNTSGVPTLIKAAVTNTASGAGALLMNLLAGAGGATSMFSVSATGVVTTAGQLNANSFGSVISVGDVRAGAANAFYWNTASQMTSPANGQLNFINSSNTAGVGFDFATDAVLKLRTRAQSAYATLDVLGLKASGVAGASFGPGLPTSITVVNGIITAIS